ncbi:bis(5'-adenosyl)-triphosphatase Ecym_3204 [Eremothecium cymbalariae DBVPG|uniref:Bis(5'-adenosyl)-triphosphatase n=1 Tax=Eremothecium cymbalariae (strain CBS 270.75 / DBVPG 7215 / KCTC 17166 / NRRL Y-17582) TaxID=931890 RepID=G8JRD4_ERECY|nr:Hypothetical protein Ecym_3204 [Eremothecium cymbalariae DBVPG\
MMSASVFFSKYLVTDQIFYKTKHCYALVNLRPIVPGHILIVPLRTSCIHLKDLNAEELSDYFKTLQVVQQFIQEEYRADSLNIAIQDGPEAGQTVPHLHTHVIPRYKLNNIGDKIYQKMDNWTFDSDLHDWEKRRAAYISNEGREATRELAKPDDQKAERTPADLKREALYLGEKLQQFLSKNPHLAP